MAKDRYQRRSPAQWHTLIQQWQRSELSQAQFCRERGLALSTFQLWRRRLANSAGVAADVSEAPPASADRVKSRLLPVQILADSAGPRPTGSEAHGEIDGSSRSGLRLVISPQLSVEIAPDFDPLTLRRVVSALAYP